MPRIPLIDSASITLSVILHGLNCMATSVPHIHPVTILATAIICNIQQLKANKKAFARLGQDVYDLVQAIAEVEIHSVALQDGADKFTAVLEQILNYLLEHRARNLIHRFFGAVYDASRIGEYRGQIQTAREALQLQIDMRTHENVFLLVRESNERNAALADPPPYISVDPTIPEEVRRIAEEDSERLLPILGVVSVFQGPPTIKQIARILGVAEDEVRAVWSLIAAHLDELDADGETRCFAFLVRLVCLANETPSIDLPTYHNLVAQWCLVGPKGGAKDVFYAANSWAHHVCHSDPSPQLCSALAESEIPLASESSEELLEIIAWLEEFQTDDLDEQWGGLLSTYRARLTTAGGT
ncbi:hypothetical protein K438DRAFT_1990338 [Mycena galopus ATCC 62051]|nr:hypothetical protein K438DRAFT_1990338 [Mycena galopus ATCC 62051]